MAGASVSAWRLPRADVSEREHAFVAADGAADLHASPSRCRGSASAAPRRRGPSARAQRRAPTSDGSSRTRPRARRSSRSSSSSPNVEPHLEEVGRQRRHDGVAPLDERDAAVVEQLRRPRSRTSSSWSSRYTSRWWSGEPALVVVRTSVNVGLVIGSVDAERRAEALGERGLAGAELAGEQHEVAGDGRASATRRADGARVVGRRPSVRMRARRAHRRRERLLGPDEVGPHLRQRLAAAPQHRRRDGTSGSSTPSPVRIARPRSLVMPSFVSSSSLVAKLPRVTTTLGSMRSSCCSSHGRQASISSGSRVAVARRPALDDVGDVALGRG